MTRTEFRAALQTATPDQLDAFYVALIGYPPIAECGDAPDSVRAILVECADDDESETVERIATL